MVKILTIDIGNTRMRYALFEEGEIVLTGDGPPEKSLIEDAEFVGYCSVSDTNFRKIENFLKNKENVYHLSALNQRILKINYRNPATLGDDRVANAMFVYFKYKGEGIIIDAGTFITVDYVSEDIHYPLAIMPGVYLLRENYTRGEKLKEFEVKISRNPLPSSTEEAMGLGLYALLKGSLELILERVKKPETPIIVTGGDGKFIQSLITDSIYEENTALWGIYYWLETNRRLK